MTVTFVGDSTDAECDGSGFVADASSNSATATERTACEANVESDGDADLAEALDLCLDPDYIGTVRRSNLIRIHRNGKSKNKNRRKKERKTTIKQFT